MNPSVLVKDEIRVVHVSAVTLEVDVIEIAIVREDGTNLEMKMTS